MITAKRQLGNIGEEQAVRYLLEKGYILLGRNAQASHHEIDIVMLDGSCLVFVEVKTRRTDTYCDPMRAVDDEKLWNLLEAYKIYRQEHPECYKMDFRIDVVCVVGNVSREDSQLTIDGLWASSQYRLVHYVNPFSRRIQAGTPWKTHYHKKRKGHFGYYVMGKK